MWINVKALQVMEVELHGISEIYCSSNYYIGLNVLQTAVELELVLPTAEPPLYPRPSLQTLVSYWLIY